MSYRPDFFTLHPLNLVQRRSDKARSSLIDFSYLNRLALRTFIEQDPSF